jgi:hypothetical protein
MKIRKRHKIVGAVVLAATLPLTMASACTGSPSASNKAETKQGDYAQLINNQPLPKFNHSQERQNLIEIESARAKGVQSTTFFFNLGARDPIQTCTSIGAPIASTTQLSNPQQLARTGGQYNVDGVISQMDPTGTYTGDSSGTWSICVDAQGQPYADYWEGFVQTVFAPAVWDPATHTIKITGPASFHFTRGK